MESPSGNFSATIARISVFVGPWGLSVCLESDGSSSPGSPVVAGLPSTSPSLWRLEPSMHRASATASSHCSGVSSLSMRCRISLPAATEARRRPLRARRRATSKCWCSALSRTPPMSPCLCASAADGGVPPAPSPASGRSSAHLAATTGQQRAHQAGGSCASASADRSAPSPAPGALATSTHFFAGLPWGKSRTTSAAKPSARAAAASARAPKSASPFAG
mmetsp:Transcript_7718/g.20939  ORF Transcript_7718/g.20939 Transcript_7718/m.20939 type:complete len:220 (+) Transcript_7718:3-662(+)